MRECGCEVTVIGYMQESSTDNPVGGNVRSGNGVVNKQREEKREEQPTR